LYEIGTLKKPLRAGNDARKSELTQKHGVTINMYSRREF
jgi:hypothetical protein